MSNTTTFAGGNSNVEGTPQGVSVNPSVRAACHAAACGISGRSIGAMLHPGEAQVSSQSVMRSGPVEIGGIHF